jgi:predicted O-linked N-acetylglucosamine transferase (SPINDLY family)
MAQYPGDGFSWKLLGASLFRCGEECAEILAKAATLSPDDVECHNLLGSALMKCCRFSEAEAAFRRALQLRPDYAYAHFNLAMVLGDLERFPEAEISCRQALALSPDFADALCYLGRLLGELARPGEAEGCLRQALALKPDFTEGWASLGVILKDQGRLADAGAAFERALQLNPEYVLALSNLLFIQNYTLDARPASCLERARHFGAVVGRSAKCQLSPSPAHPHPGPLRVGLVSGDLHNHPIGYFLEGVIEKIDPARITLLAYPTKRRGDALTDRLRPHFAHWTPIAGMSDEAAARRIHADAVDVLIDLSGHTANNRLSVFCWRPAAVQLSWLGYFATTGVAEMDFLLADPWTLLPEEEPWFSERIWRLPETRLCFTQPEEDVPVAPLPAMANGFVTFGCFNDLKKISDSVVGLWARVMLAVPDSRLFLKAAQLGEAAACARMVERFAAHGIAEHRLMMAGRSTRHAYLAAYGEVDIALDPFPYPGGTTTAEALWMGVPVLTLAGERFLSRQGVGLLMNAGLPEWVACDAADYVSRAAAHANDIGGLTALRAGLRAQVLASPLFDAPRFARHMEAALFGMWESLGKC